jgi:hypothetical protein
MRPDGLGGRRLIGPGAADHGFGVRNHALRPRGSSPDHGRPRRRPHPHCFGVAVRGHRRAGPCRRIPGDLPGRPTDRDAVQRGDRRSNRGGSAAAVARRAESQLRRRLRRDRDKRDVASGSRPGLGRRECASAVRKLSAAAPVSPNSTPRPAPRFSDARSRARDWRTGAGARTRAFARRHTNLHAIADPAAAEALPVRTKVALPPSAPHGPAAARSDAVALAFSVKRGAVPDREPWVVARRLRRPPVRRGRQEMARQ